MFDKCSKQPYDADTKPLIDESDNRMIDVLLHT